MELGTWNRSPRRPGYTLAELLIVILIMIMLVSITLPTVKRVMEDGNVREASRQFNAYFAMAKARALQTGRPCGVMLRCDLPVGVTADPTAAAGFPAWTNRIVTQMYLAEVPPPYAGSIVGSKGRIMLSQTAGALPGTYEFHPLTPSGTVDGAELAILGGLIQDGESFLVRFEFKGPWYVCQRVGAFLIYQHPIIRPIGLTQAGSNTPYPPAMNLATTFEGYPYQILRMPRRIGNPLELSAGTCIDLAYSGIGPTNLPSQTVNFGMYPCNSSGGGTIPFGLFPGSPPGPQKLEYLTVMFQPDGGIDSILLNSYPMQPSTAVHFLIGKSDKLNPPLAPNAAHGSNRYMFDPNTSNLADPLSLWVSVSRTTGNVNTAENAPPTTDLSATTATSMNINVGSPNSQTINPSNAGDQTLYLALCRQNATNWEQIRGK